VNESRELLGINGQRHTQLQPRWQDHFHDGIGDDSNGHESRFGFG